MANAKQDMMKEIEAKVARKKMLATKTSRQKTIANWVAEFFVEYEKTKKIDDTSFFSSFKSLALDRLNIQLRSLDRKCKVYFKDPKDESSPIVEIHWTTSFIQTNSCEEVLIFDASSAHFESALEDI